MEYGKLQFKNTKNAEDLLSERVAEFIKKNELNDVLVAEIDPNLSDTAEFCQNYDITTQEAANCVIVEASRGNKVWYGAVLIDGASRADINGIVRKHLNARKISFAPPEAVVCQTSMEFGAITPIGLPKEWVILVDKSIAMSPHVIIGSGVRHSKLLVSGELLCGLPGAEILDLRKPQL